MPAPTPLLTSLVLAATLAIPCVQPAVAGPTGAEPGAPGIGDRYYPKDGNGGIDVRHYDVDVTYEFETDDQPARVTGVTTLRIRAKHALTSFNLDLLLPVDAVAVDGAGAEYTKHPHELRITPAAPIAEGELFTVRVEYAGEPDAVTYLGEDNWLADHAEVVTMNEPHMAPWWFPSNDHPRDKARFDIEVTTDADKQVISNGELVDETPVGGGLATTHWRMKRPMTTYLAYFAAGRFEVTEGTTGGIPWVTAVSERFADTAQRRYKRIVNRSGEITRWMEGELGDYPFDSTGGLVTTLPSGFALENQTRPTYSGGIGEEVLVHELAHQWFGNSVSVRRWRDIWLNEGFATYMEVRYKAQHGGASVREWLLRTHRWYDDPHSGFWQVNIANPGAEIHQLFSWPVYERGAMALAALRGKLGGATFDRLLRTWGTKNEYGVAQVGDFVRMAERAAGHQLDRFFRVWLREPEAPARTEANGF